MDDIGFDVSLVLLLIFVAFAIMWYLKKRRKTILDKFNTDKPEWIEDNAHNQILTTKALIDRAERNGDDVAAARSRLQDAEDRAKAGDFEQAFSIAKQARDVLPKNVPTRAVKRKVPVQSTSPPSPSPKQEQPGVAPAENKEEMLYRDIATGGVVSGGGQTREDMSPKRPEDQEEGEKPPMVEFRQKVPKNYLEAKFEISLLEDALTKLPPESSPESRKLLVTAKKAWEKENYSDALRMAMRGKRALEQKSDDTIPLTAGTTVDVPPQTPVAAAARSSAPMSGDDYKMEPATGEARPTTVVCSRCNKENPAKNKFCRGCGKPLAAPLCPRCQKAIEADDAFCGTCGAPVSQSV